MRTRGAPRWVVGACLVGAMALVTACSSNAPAADSSGSQSGAPQTIKLWTVAYGGGNDAVKGIISDFEAANPGVKVEYTVKPDQQLKDSIRTAVLSDASPDVFQIWNGNTYKGYLQQNDALLPLDKYYTQYNWADRFSAAAVDSTKIDGASYGVPWALQPIALFYKKSALEKAGVTQMPTTLPELTAAFDKIKAAGMTPLSIGGKFSWNTMFVTDNLLMASCGKEKLDAFRALDPAAAGDPCVSSALGTLREWVTKEYLPKDFLSLDPNSGESNSLMYADKAAMVAQGAWLVPGLTSDGQNPDDFGVMPFPGVDTQYLGNEQMLISKKSANPDLAAKFIDYATSPEVQSKYYGKLNTPVSPVKGATAPASQSQLAGEVTTLLNNPPAGGFFGTTDLSLPANLVGPFFQAQDDSAAGKAEPAVATETLKGAVERYKATNG